MGALGIEKSLEKVIEEHVLKIGTVITEAVVFLSFRILLLFLFGRKQ